MCGYGETIAKISPYKGVPTLFINGVPQSGMTDAAFLPSVEKFSSFTWAGIDLYSICSDPLAGHPGVSEDTWKEDKSYDYSELDARVKIILDANPKAWIFPRLDLYAPAWWAIPRRSSSPRSPMALGMSLATAISAQPLHGPRSNGVRTPPTAFETSSGMWRPPAMRIVSSATT